MGIEVGDTKTKGLNMYIYVIRKTVTHALIFFGNEVNKPCTLKARQIH